MQIPLNNVTKSPIFQNAVKQGAQILEDGSAYLWKYSNKVPNRLIQKTIAPNGSYAIQISKVNPQNNTAEITKIIRKNILSPNSHTVDTWDFSKSQGSWLNTVKVNEKTTLTKAHDKVSQTGFNPIGIVYQITEGMKRKNHQFVKMFCNLPMPQMNLPNLEWAKNFDPKEVSPVTLDGFIKLFNK